MEVLVAIFADVVSERELASELGLTVWALRAWRKRSYGPKHRKIGRGVFYKREDVLDFINARVVE